MTGIGVQELAELSLWHRTIDTLHEVIHESDSRGLKATVEGKKACLATLILIRGRSRRPDLFVMPDVQISPRNV